MCFKFIKNYFWLIILNTLNTGCSRSCFFFCSFRYIPKSVEKLPDGKLLAKWMPTNDPTQEFSDTFDTVLFAIGRTALTREAHVDKAGVKVEGDGEKIDALNEQTNIPNIFAVGDVLYVS